MAGTIVMGMWNNGVRLEPLKRLTENAGCVKNKESTSKGKALSSGCYVNVKAYK